MNSTIASISTSSFSSSSWSFSNIENALPKDIWESFVDHNVPAGIMIGCLVISLSYPITNYFLNKYSKKYRQLDKDKQLVVVHHTIEAIILGLLFAPLTYLVSSLYFQNNTSSQMHTKVSILGTLMFVIIIMYLFEIASRYQHLRPLVVVHHLCAYADSLFPALCLTTANLKAASLLVYFITYESLIFVGLVMYRLYPNHRWTKPIIMTGMIVFVLSRPIQLIWIVGGLAATWKDLVVWQAIIQLLLTTLFTALQLYSTTIHYTLWRKCGATRRHEEDNQDYVSAILAVLPQKSNRGHTTIDAIPESTNSSSQSSQSETDIEAVCQG